MKKTYVVAIVVVIVAALVIAGIYFKSNNDSEVAPPPSITGEVACLPLKNPDEGVNDTMCMKGIKNEAGLFLEVRTMSQDQLELGKTVEVKGEIAIPDENSKYQTAGVIVNKQVE